MLPLNHTNKKRKRNPVLSHSPTKAPSSDTMPTFPGANRLRGVTVNSPVGSNAKSGAAAKSLSNLPTELLHMIWDDLRSASVGYREFRQSLVNVGMTCKRLYKFTLPYLYHTIFAGKIDFSGQATDPTCLNFPKLIRTLFNNRNLRNHIRQICLDYHGSLQTPRQIAGREVTTMVYGSVRANQPCLSQALKQHLGTNLRGVKSMDRSWSVADWGQSRWIPTLLLLAMAPNTETCIMTSSTCFQFLNPLRGLDEKFKQQIHATYTALRSLKIFLRYSHDGSQDSLPLGQLLQFTPNLDTLTLSSGGHRARVPDLQVYDFDALHVRSLVLEDLGIGSGQSATLRQLANAMAATLTKICIYIDCTGGNRRPRLMQELLIPLSQTRAASTLKVLHIDGAVMDSGVPNTITHFPSLDVLGLRFDWQGHRMAVFDTILKDCHNLCGFLVTAADQISPQEMQGFAWKLKARILGSNLKRVVLIPREYRRPRVRAPGPTYWQNLKAAVPWAGHHFVDEAGIEWVLEGDNTKPFTTIVEETEKALGL